MSGKAMRSGRPAGSDGSRREVILAAAREQFAAKGIKGATMRSIATQAEVDVALVAHYFTNKAGLFAEAVALPEQAGAMLAQAMRAPAGHQGEEMVRGYLDLWENPRTGSQMRVLVRSAMSDQGVQGHLVHLMTDLLRAQLAVTRPPGGERGLVLALSQLLGVAATRYLVAAPPMVDLDLEDLVASLSPGIQALLDTPQG